MKPRRRLGLTLALSLLGALLGAVGGAEFILHRPAPAPLHALLHRRLRLDAAQERAFEGLEQDHAAREKALEAEMRAANADLAQALERDHAYTPRMQAAIDRFHLAMGRLQTETMVHILAMRRVLTPAQAAEFDRTVASSLTADAK